MLNLQGKKNKVAQYAIGGVVAFIVLLLWISVPLMDKSPWNTSVPQGNPFSSKSVDLRSLSDSTGYESGAPGSPLSGELTYNPATSGENIDSSLYRSGFDDLSSDDESLKNDIAASKGSALKYASSASSPNIPRGKLNIMASIGSGGSNTGTSGKRHSKFFGGGNDRAKIDMASYNASIGKIKKSSKLLASVDNAQKKSKKALDFQGRDEKGRSAIASAFNKLIESGSSELTTGLKDSAAESGIVAGTVNGDTLKKNLPDINKSEYTPPAPDEADEEIDNDEQYKQMIMQMIIGATLGSAFGAMGTVISSAISPPKDSKGQDLSTKDISNKDDDLGGE